MNSDKTPSHKIPINTLAEMIKNKKSMLKGPTPLAYSAILTDEDATDKAFSGNNRRMVRAYIVWDFPANSESNNLEEIIERMRETGAAMVEKVEEVF